MIQSERNRERGFTLLEMSIALAVAGLLFMGLFQLMATLNQQLQDQAVARQTKAIAAAAVDYARSESQAIRALGSGEIWQEIDFVDDGNPATLPALQPTYLPNGASQTNILGQTYRVFIHKDDDDRIESFVTVTGATTPLNDLRAARIAGLVGSDGGAIYSQNDQLIQGAYGGWSKAKGDFPPAVQALLGTGDIVVGSMFADNIIDAPYLYRDPVSGHPEFNAMTTNIDMNSNNLNEVNTISGRNSSGTRVLALKGETVTIIHPDDTSPFHGDPPPIPGNYYDSMLDLYGSLRVEDISAWQNVGIKKDLYVGCPNPLNCTTYPNLYTAKIGANGSISGRYLSISGGSVSLQVPSIDLGPLGGNAGRVDVTNAHLNVEGGNFNTMFPGASKFGCDIISGETCGNPKVIINHSNGDITTGGNITTGILTVNRAGDRGEDYSRFAGPVEFNYRSSGGAWNSITVKGRSTFEEQAMFYKCPIIGGLPFCNNPSDRRLKDKIQSIEGALDKLLRIKGVTYVWKTDGRKDMGVIAQDVEKVFPEAVQKNDKGFLAVEYGHLVGPIIEAIRELKTENDALEVENNTLKAENKDLRDRMNHLEEKVDILFSKEK